MHHMKFTCLLKRCHPSGRNFYLQLYSQNLPKYLVLHALTHLRDNGGVVDFRAVAPSVHTPL